MIKRVSITVVVVLFALGVTVAQQTPCDEVLCPSLSFEIGSVQYSNGQQIGSAAAFSCPPLFSVDGAETSVCQANGQWSSGPPTCARIQCPTPSIVNGAVSFTDGVYAGSIATFSCNSLFVLKGTAKLTCGDTGVWSGSYPVCAPILCPVPSIENGAFSYDGLTPGSTATFTCHSGFDLKTRGDSPSSVTLTCETSGYWTQSFPICYSVPPRFCSVLKVDNCVVTYNGDRSPGTIADITCPEGFVLQGPAAAQCMPWLLWDITVIPKCVPVTCPPLSPPALGTLTFVPSNQPAIYGESVCLSCECGYSPEGVDHAYCQADGTWSAPLAPACQPVPLGCTQPREYWSGAGACNWPAPFVMDSNCNCTTDPIETCHCEDVKRLVIGLPWNPEEGEPGDEPQRIYSQCQLLTAFALPIDQPLGPNALRILARQLIAAKFNVLNGALACFPADPADPTSTPAQIIAFADARIRRWNILTDRVPTASTTGRIMLRYATLLEIYNSGGAGIPSCP